MREKSEKEREERWKKEEEQKKRGKEEIIDGNHDLPRLRLLASRDSPRSFLSFFRANTWNLRRPVAELKRLLGIYMEDGLSVGSIVFFQQVSAVMRLHVHMPMCIRPRVHLNATNRISGCTKIYARIVETEKWKTNIFTLYIVKKIEDIKFSLSNNILWKKLYL